MGENKEMGKKIKAGKPKTKGNKPKEKIEMTRSKVKQMKNEISVDILTFFMSCLIDEFDYSFEEIERFSERFARYYTAVKKEHLLSRKDIRKIVERMLDCEMEIDYTEANNEEEQG